VTEHAIKRYSRTLAYLGALSRVRYVTHPLRVRSALLAACGFAALVLSSGASGHVVPEPQFLPTGVVTTLDFAVPNERPEPMSGVTISVPAGLHIVRAHPTAGWTSTQDGSTSTWQGGPLAHLSIETFRLDVDVTAPPGQATLDTMQLYPSGARVSWPATLTVVPGQADEGAQSVGWGVIADIVGAGLLAAACIAVLAWRR
jgi:hypothetical protein